MSLYENINKLSNFEFHKNKSLQNKIKSILKEKPDNDDTNSLSSSNSGYVNNKPKYHLNSNINQSIKNIIKLYPIRQKNIISEMNLPYISNSGKNTSHINATNKNVHKNIINMKKEKFDKRKSVVENRRQIFSEVLESEKVSKKKDSLKNKSVNNITNISNITNTNNKSNINIYINRKFSHAKTNKMNKSIIKDKNKLKINKTLFIQNNSSNDFSKKKKNISLLSKINSNIIKTNQNLNNPDEFYSNYFQSILEEEKKNMDEIEKKKFSMISENLSPRHNKFNRVKIKLVKK